MQKKIPVHSAGGRLMLMGAERRVSHAQTRKRGPPSAQAEFTTVDFLTLSTFYTFSVQIFLPTKILSGNIALLQKKTDWLVFAVYKGYIAPLTLVGIGVGLDLIKA